jgi:TatD DNase family protein
MNARLPENATCTMSHMSSPSSPSESRRAKAARRAGEFPPAPEPLAIPVFDSHTHLDLTVQEAGALTDTGGGDPVEALISAAAKAGVDRLVQVGVDVSSSRWGADAAEKYSAVLAAVALHPNEAPRLSDLDEALREIEALAARPRVRGIGETGMDTFRTGDEGRAAQEESFRAHIAIAKRHRKALIIHDREAHDDVLRILDAEGAPDTVVLHCFSGDAEFAAACVRRGFYLSFAGTVTFASAAGLRAAAWRPTRRTSRRCRTGGGRTRRT